MNHNLKYGLALGLINVALSLAILLIDYHLLTSTWFGVLPLIINIAVLVVAGYELRKLHGGYLPFKEAFVSTFLIIVIAGAISLLYNILVFTVFSPEMADALHQDVIDRTAGMMEGFGADDTLIDQTIADLETNNPYSIGNLMVGYGYSLILGLVLALIIGAIVKKKQPEFE